MKVPGVYYVGVGYGGILIGVFIHTHDQTAKAESSSPAIEALPAEIEGLPLKVKPVYILPPPPGVIVVHPDGIREEADECPAGFQEYINLSWRFCLGPGVSTVPTDIMEPPIAGIPHEECLQILERHREFLEQLPGMESVGMGAGGISVYTSNPDVVPAEVEGLPIITKPALGRGILSNHTITNQIRPLHGGVDISEDPAVFPLSSRATLTGIAVADGKPWLIFPSHMTHQCASPSPCPPPASPSNDLNACPHNVIIPATQQHAGTLIITQPDTDQPTIKGRVGWLQRWDPIRPGGLSTDVAAAFMDDDSNEQNGSLRADRKQEMLQAIRGHEFTGITRPARANEGSRYCKLKFTARHERRGDRY